MGHLSETRDRAEAVRRCRRLGSPREWQRTLARWILVSAALLSAPFGQVFLASGEPPELVDNSIHAVGSWRISHVDGDLDDYWLVIVRSSGTTRINETEEFFPPRDVFDEDPAGWWLQFEIEDTRSPATILGLTRIDDDTFSVEVTAHDPTEQLLLRLQRLSDTEVHDQQMKRAMQEALDFCEIYQPSQVAVIECAKDYSVQQRKEDSASPVWRDAEYFFLSYLAVLNGDIATIVGAAGLLPFYNALKSVAFGTGTEAQLRTILSTLGLANDEPLSEPGGYPWAIRGLFAGFISTGLYPGVTPTEPMQPFAPGQPVVPVLPFGRSLLSAAAVLDPADSATKTFVFPVGVKMMGTTKPIYLDSAFGKVKGGKNAAIYGKYELDDTVSTRFKSVVIPTGILTKGTTATLYFKDRDYPLQEGKKFTFPGGATSFFVQWPVITAKGGKPGKYVLGLTFTKTTALVSITQGMVLEP